MHDAPFPGPTSSSFGLRNGLRFVRGQLGLLRELTDRYGDRVSLSVFGERWLLLRNPDDIETVAVKNARIMGRDTYTDILQRVLGVGLLTSDGELWKRQRLLMAQAFTPKRIRDYATSMSRVTEASLASWRDGEVINLHQEMSRVTMEVVADVLFGASVTPQDVSDVREALEDITDFLASSPEAVAGIPGWVPTPRLRRFTRAMKVVDRIVYGLIARRRSGEARDDLLGTLLAAQDEAGAGMSDQQLRDEVTTLFLAGHETTALALAHTLYLLALHPQVERRVHAELESVLGGRAPTADDVRALSFTDRVLKEAIRLFPPAWTIGRGVTEPFELRGVRVPERTQILMSPWLVHRDARFFPNPEAFDPDRWEPARAKDLPRYAYFPFGAGPRVCIGNHFAMMEAALILAIVLRDHHIELLPGQQLVLQPSVTLRQKGPGLLARVVARTPRA